MSPLDDLDLTPLPADDSGTLLLDLVTAVDYLRLDVFPGFTVWDAIEQALRWHANFEADFAEPDPLARALRVVMAQSNTTAVSTLDDSLWAWLGATSVIYNEAQGWR